MTKLIDRIKISGLRTVIGLLDRVTPGCEDPSDSMYEVPVVTVTPVKGENAVGGGAQVMIDVLNEIAAEMRKELGNTDPDEDKLLRNYIYGRINTCTDALKRYNKRMKENES